MTIHWKILRGYNSDSGSGTMRRRRLLSMLVVISWVVVFAIHLHLSPSTTPPLLKVGDDVCMFLPLLKLALSERPFVSANF